MTQKTVVSTSHINVSKPRSFNLRSTSLISVLDKHRTSHVCQVLLDSGSPSDFMTEKMSQILKLPAHKVLSEINGIGQSTTTTSHFVQCTIKSR